MAHKGVTYVLRPPEPGTDGRPIAPVLVAVIERGIRVVLIVGAALFLAHGLGRRSRDRRRRQHASTASCAACSSAVVILLAPISAGTSSSGDRSRGGSLKPPGPGLCRAPTRRGARRGCGRCCRSSGTCCSPHRRHRRADGAVLARHRDRPADRRRRRRRRRHRLRRADLVKDVISGIFYLLDDAFRVGEYIQSGTYKGTVESFSLRSVKLRHHRGPVYTVPFGELGAVQNMSRDWVIDKFAINVNYQTDLEKARKIIKKIGQNWPKIRNSRRTSSSR